MAFSPRSASSSIQVVVRLRPMNEKEKKHGTLPVVSGSTQDKSVNVIKGTGFRQVRSSFHFDHVFTAFSTQEEVFEDTLKPVIGDVMKGFESTVFAYGQTGTGKTHTMEGDLSSPEMHGVIPRSAQAIFETLAKPQYSDHSVSCSYLEIYNEDLCDLLSDEVSQPGRIQQGSSKLEIMEGKNGTFCRGLVEKKVNSAGDVLALMHKAQQQRRIGETKMNKQSSRSHCIFTVRVQAKLALMDGNGTMEFHGKLHLVDLAGSECAKTASMDRASPAEIARERERMNINRSLLTLGRVISMLKEQSESKKSKGNVRIPYRDSKLTRILQESLGGRCKTVIVATLSPSITAIEESISTLNYAQSANGIINKPVSTSYISITPRASSSNSCGFGSESKHIDQGTTVEHWHEVECRLQYMQAQVEEAQAALARKHMHQQELVDRAEKAEADRLDMEDKYRKATIEIKSLENQLSAEVNRRQHVESRLKETEIVLKKTAAILKVTQQTEVSLTSEATALLRTLQESIADGDTLHSMIVDYKKFELERKNATADFQSAAVAVLEATLASLSDVAVKANKFYNHVVSSADEGQKRGRASISETSALIKEIVESVEAVTSSIKSQINSEGGVNPILNNMSSSIQSSISDVSNNVSRGEKNLLNTCASIRTQLEKNAENLNELQAKHSASSKEVLSNLEVSITSSQEKIIRMIEKATEALSVAENAKTEANRAHSNLLSEWENISNEKAKEIEGAAKFQSEAISEALGFFTGEMRHHDNMGNTLESQRSFLTDKGCAHVEGVAKQGNMLIEQESMLSQLNKSNKQFREEFMRNIMTGVQEIVNKQIEHLANKDEQQFDALKTNNKGLSQNNDSIVNSAKQVIGEMDGTNTSLRSLASKVRENDARLTTVMEETNTILSKIASDSSAHQVSTSALAETAKDQMKKIVTLDAETANILETIKGDSEGCRKHLDSSVLRDTSDGIHCLTRKGDEIRSYSATLVIPNALNALNEMVKPREGVMDVFDKNLNQISEQLSSGCASITETTGKQYEAASNLFSVVDNKQNYFLDDLAVKYGAQTDCQKEKLMQNATEFENISVAKLTASSSQATEVQAQICDYAINIARVQEDIVPAPSRTNHIYSQELTSTPSDEVILKDIDFEIKHANEKEKVTTVAEDNPSDSYDPSNTTSSNDKKDNQSQQPPVITVTINQSAEKENNIPTVDTQVKVKSVPKKISPTGTSAFKRRNSARSSSPSVNKKARNGGTPSRTKKILTLKRGNK